MRRHVLSVIALTLGLGVGACGQPESQPEAKVVALKAPQKLVRAVRHEISPPEKPTEARRCPEEMVDIGGEFCIDRYETSLIEPKSGRAVSPYFHPSFELGNRDRREWKHVATSTGSWKARHTPLPQMPDWQRKAEFEIRAESKKGVVPNAYFDLERARDACTNAKKRLCSREQWLKACQGERATRHPYGQRYVAGRCAVDGPLHPASVLPNPNADYRDPRLNRVEHRGKAVLSVTGSKPECRSPWGDDAVYDMVGNLDEWVDDPKGTFVGGFYARDTKLGCDMRIEIHSADYYDYSIGSRCCLDGPEGFSAKPEL